MKPINDRVIVKPAPAEEKTKGGIIIPDTVKEKPQRGEVVAVGPGTVSYTHLDVYKRQVLVTKYGERYPRSNCIPNTS